MLENICDRKKTKFKLTDLKGLLSYCPVLYKIKAVQDYVLTLTMIKSEGKYSSRQQKTKRRRIKTPKQIIFAHDTWWSGE